MSRSLRWKSLILAAVAATASLAAAGAHAQTIYGFGDSLLDTRRTCALGTYPSGSFGTCSNGEGALEFLPSYSRYSFSKANDYASGGAGTGAYNLVSFLGPALAPGVDTQISEFAAAGGRIGADDLVVMSGISNNVYELQSNPALTGQALAATTLADIQRGVSGLIGAGARNIVYYGGTPADAGVTEITTPQAAAYSAGVNNGLASTLAAFARPGLRIRLFDFEAVYEKAVLQPAYYGFTATGECVADPTCVHASMAVQDQRFLYDVHPTQPGEQLLARYIGKLITSDDGLAAQSEIAGGASDDFTGALLRRLDAGRAYSRDGFSVDAASPGHIQLFADGGHAYSDRDDWSGPGGAADGYGDETDALEVGASYRADAHTREGLSIGYTRSDGRLNDNAGAVDVDSVHVAGFASLTWPNRFADLVVGYSRHDLFADRSGVVGRLDGAPQGDAITAAAQTAWLIPLGPVQVGPIANVTYDRTRIGAYTETGDPILTQHVEAQTLQTLLGGVGLEARSSFQALGRPVQPFLNLTAEHDFLDGSRTLLSENTNARALPVYTVIGAGQTTRTFGLATAGVTTSIVTGLALVVDAQASAFGQGSGYAVNAGLSHAF